MLTIDWTPNPKDCMPLYRQIVLYIKDKIRTGEWPVHSRLPSQRDLACMFHVNRSTLTTALDELIADGLLSSKTGSGTWVANNTWSIVTSHSSVNWNSYMNSGLVSPNFSAIQEINRSEFNPQIIRLGTGELAPEIIFSNTMKQIIKKIPDRITSFGYEEPKGLLFLRRQLSNYLTSFNIHASPSSILIVSGALQALQLICFSLLPRNSILLLEKPSYLFSLQMFQSINMRFCGLPLDQEGITSAPISYQKQRNRTAVLYTIPCFHNPTGILMSARRRQEIFALCQQKQIPILEDDVYRELWLDTPPPKPLKAIDRDGLVIYIGSFSKTLSPGLRIGWVVGPEPVIERLADIKMQNDYGSSSLSQWAAAEWIASGRYEEHLSTVRHHLKIRRKIALETLTKYFSDIASWTIPRGGFYIWLKLTQPISMQKLFKIALKNNLLIHPGNIYDPLSNQYLRLSYSYADLPDLQDGLFRLSVILRNLNNHSLSQ